MSKSNYFARVDGEICTGCAICLDRCQMEAIKLLDEKASIDLDRCVGCGLCVTTCPTEVLSLVKKSPGELYIAPDKPFEAYRRIAMERGKI